MHPLHQKAIRFIKANKLISGGENVLVALSGGADSVFLLDFLYSFKSLFKISIGAFHLNHSLRGAEAARDSSFCGSLCEQYQVPFYYKKRNVASYAKKHGYSVEEAARAIRYEELALIAEKDRFDLIATGHIIEDNSETMFLNLIRGAGLNGLSGIPAKRGNIIRPILGLRKEEITEYLNGRGIEYKTDSTNKAADFDRNFLRINILPQIRVRLNSSLDETLLKTSRTLSFYRNFIEENFVIPYTEELLASGISEVGISLIPFRELNEILQARILQEICLRKFKILISSERISEILSLIDKQPGRYVQLEGSVTALRERTGLKIFLKVESDFTPVNVIPGKWTEAGEVNILIEQIKKGEVIHTPGNDEEIAGFVTKPQLFHLRRWKDGDRFSPLGMKGMKLVSDFLTDHHTAAGEKRKQLVLTAGNKVVWLVGKRIDNRFKVTGSTKYFYRMKVVKNG